MCTQTLTRHQVNRRCISPSLAELCIGNVVMVNENKKKMYVYICTTIYMRYAIVMRLTTATK